MAEPFDSDDPTAEPFDDAAWIRRGYFIVGGILALIGVLAGSVALAVVAAALLLLGGLVDVTIAIRELRDTLDREPPDDEL